MFLVCENFNREMKEILKEISKEFPISKLECSNILSLYRFPVQIKPMTLTEAKIKPASKYTEVSVSLPNKNASALKEKTLNIDSLAYRAHPTAPSNLFYAKIEDGRLILARLQNVYLFQPFHFYYQYDYTPSKLKKAESREEYEHRMRSINYKLKSIDLEESKVLKFEESNFTPKINPNSVEKQAVISQSIAVNLKKLEETIKRTRIVNMSVLVGIFKNENTVKSTLFKMTDQLCGRFILKNSFYEKNLHNLRNQMVDIFRENQKVGLKDLMFLGDERWMAEELADVVDGFYHLKGKKEYVEFDNNSIRAANLSSIRDILRNQRLMTTAQISDKLSVDENIVSELMTVENGFLHLSNNSYSLDDHSDVLSEMFRLFVDKKSFELHELTAKLDQNDIKYDEMELVGEIKKYCMQRAGKFYLKSLI